VRVARGLFSIRSQNKKYCISFEDKKTRSKKGHKKRLIKYLHMIDRDHARHSRRPAQQQRRQQQQTTTSSDRNPTSSTTTTTASSDHHVTPLARSTTTVTTTLGQKPVVSTRILFYTVPLLFAWLALHRCRLPLVVSLLARGTPAEHSSTNDLERYKIFVVALRRN
jgi:hypothetical protein